MQKMGGGSAEDGRVRRWEYRRWEDHTHCIFCRVGSLHLELAMLARWCLTCTARSSMVAYSCTLPLQRQRMERQGC